MARRVDEMLEASWNAAGVTAAQPATDGEFLRRASLDLTGVIPRVSRVREFLADDRPDKRARLIDELLESPRYATHMATTWRNRMLPNGVPPERAREALGLQKWLRDRFERNLRYDNLVAGLLLTTGDDQLGPALFYRANDLAPEKLAASTSELFLGVSLQCAQCHDHPYTDWSQRDFWGMAAFFARVRAPGAASMQASYYRLEDAKQGEVRVPETDIVAPPTYPREGEAKANPLQSRRMQLAIWMTSPGNRLFSRAAVNWAWSHLFGRGLVRTVEDVNTSNPSANAQILEELADYFVDSGYDVKELLRVLATTRAYQLSSQDGRASSAPPNAFARMAPKPLTPEQLYDSLVLLAPSADASRLSVGATPAEAGMMGDAQRREFVDQMRTPPGDPTDYRASTLQALRLMNGRMTGAVASPDGSLLGAIDGPYLDDPGRVETLFLATVARPPSDQERSSLEHVLAAAETEEAREAALSDLLWALINSTEFAFNH